MLPSREGCDHGPFEEMPSISVGAAAKSFLRSRSEVAGSPDRRFVRQKIQSEMAIDEKMGGMKIAPLPLLAAATAIAVAAATPFTAAKNFRDDFARFFRRYDGRAAAAAADKTVWSDALNYLQEDMCTHPSAVGGITQPLTHICAGKSAG